ncbi:Actin superfamily ATPase [Methanonatronarchaeum thermophilum]|uniref:Actin superfamily ATPase n=1 Tax=Methanonatronarchaeum thermophilum TaxID=1927129 RepID=A0A1Y3GC36_9EURY|nr:DUF1786 family protein [Methanonatronarchaeum thermophilum]OUJ19021.1 Actin superfamily ATPase [Methanonatronarchaeum thermophilum]
MFSNDSGLNPLTMAVDVGKGTQDVLYADKLDENVVKMVLPSPTRVVADKIRQVDGDLLCTGKTMGGGPVSKVIRNHVRSNDVVMVESAARTISDNLDFVRDMGITVIGSDEVGDYQSYTEIEFTDILLDEILRFLSSMQLKTPERIGVGVQDHGVAPEGMSDRRYRFSFYREVIEGEGRLEDLVFTEKTGRFSRIDSALEQLSSYEAVALDSKIAAIIGCYNGGKEVIIDAGNGHFMAASIKKGRLVGLFEHHTRMLDDDRITELVEKLIHGEITDDEVYGDGGHGAYSLESLEPDRITVTGPRRDVIPNTINYELAHPIGDVMMSGAVGIYRSFDLR